MSNEKSVSNQRSSLLQKNIIASFLIKGWSALIVLLLVPATLHCLGEYKNGIWLTISSLLLWIDNMDIGLGNGLRNKIAEYMAHGENERTRSLISSTFAMLTCIIIPVLLILLLIIAIGDPYQVFNASPSKADHLEQVLMVTVTLVCTSFIFKLIGNFYMGMQLPAVSNLLIAMGQTLALIGTYIVLWSGSHSLMLIALVNTAAPLLVYLLAYPYTFLYKYPHLRPSLRLINFKEAKAVINMGVQFFIMQISSVILFMTSNLLISNLFTPALVTPYQITYRYFSLMLVVFTVIWGVSRLSICPFLQVLKKYPHLWCMTKPPSRRPKLYIVNLQVTQVLRAASSDLGLRTGEPAIPGTSVSHSHAPWRSG